METYGDFWFQGDGRDSLILPILDTTRLEDAQRNNLSEYWTDMSAFNAIPWRPTNTRLCPHAAAVACESAPPIPRVQHLPPVPCGVPRPVDPRTQHAVAVADRAVASAYHVPTLIVQTPNDLRNLQAGTRPKTVWGVPPFTR